MSTLGEIETALRKLKPRDLKALHALIEEMLEDEVDFTDEFKASMERGWQDIEAGRVRKEEPGA
jgi:predicted transcriptional regulator